MTLNDSLRQWKFPSFPVIEISWQLINPYFLISSQLLFSLLVLLSFFCGIYRIINVTSTSITMLLRLTLPIYKYFFPVSGYRNYRNWTLYLRDNIFNWNWNSFYWFTTGKSIFSQGKIISQWEDWFLVIEILTS